MCVKQLSDKSLALHTRFSVGEKYVDLETQILHPLRRNFSFNTVMNRYSDL